MFTLTIETDNEAFSPDPAPELGRILTKIAYQMEGGSTGARVLDLNGNTVGEWRLTVETPK